MAAKSVSVLKFVGTVSLGVLTGLSYSLSSLTIPALLTLPSADSAARTFNALTTTATRHLRSLAGISSSAFILAYVLSPRPLRHPYLLYASALVLSSHIAASDLLAPYLLALGPAGRAPASASSSTAAAKKQKKKQEQERARAKMEASYEVLGSAGSDAHSEGSTGGSASGEELEGEEAGVNGEEVRAEVEVFLKKQIVRSAVAGLGFLLSVVGIWGDGVAPVYAHPVYIEI
jgi:autophagy-related protein 33